MQLKHLKTEQFAFCLSAIAQVSTLATNERRTCARLARVLQRPLRLGLIGEPRAGKSTLLNILLGAEVLSNKTLGRPCLIHVRYGEQLEVNKINPAGIRERLTPGLSRISGGTSVPEAPRRAKVVYRAREQSTSAFNQAECIESKTGDYFEIRSPLPVLRDLEIVEMPSAALREQGLNHALPLRFDLALWVSNAPQAWKHSEYRAWTEGEYGVRDRSLFVATNGETLCSQGDKMRLMERLKKETGAFFKTRYLISSNAAESLLQARSHISDSAWMATGFPQLERAIEDLVVSLREERLRRAAEICKRLETRFSSFRAIINDQAAILRESDAVYDARVS